MRILIVTADYLPNISGIATLCYEQAAGLTAAGHSVCVLTTTSGATSFNADGTFEVRVHNSPQKPVMRLWSLYRALRKAIKTFRPDFLWCANYRGFGLPTMLLCGHAKIPYGIYLHGTELVTECKRFTRRKIFQNVLDSAAVVITNSNFTGNLLRTNYRVAGVPVTPGVFPPPVETPDFISMSSTIRKGWLDQSDANDSAVIFISCSRIAPEKGLDLVIHAIAMLPPDIKNRVLYIIGGAGSSADAYKSLASKLGIEKQIIFNGMIDRADLPATLKAADVYLQPSQPHGDYIEGFGISFLEAQAMGLPCIASDWAGTPEAINRDVTGFLVPTGSAEAIAAAMTRVVEDSHWRTKAGEEAILWAAGNSWTNHTFTLEPFLMKAADPSFVEKLL